MSNFALDPKLKTVAEVAKDLGLSERRIQQMTEAGDLGARKATDLEELALRKAGRIGRPAGKGVWLIHQDTVQHLQQLRMVALEGTNPTKVGYPKHRPKSKQVKLTTASQASESTMEELLTACPLLTIVVTSRAVLHVPGEHEFSVPPLALPDLTQLPERETLVQVAAVALFIQRARTILHTFELTDTNAYAIGEICVRLDGLPLAIELAAARVKLLSPEALLARLTQRLAVLTGGIRTGPVRQQTLRNTLKWSYDLLDSEEQRLFRRLSVFVGGWTLEAVEAVMKLGKKAGGDTSSSVLDGVAALLDKSFLYRIEQDGKEPRLIMLQTVREYGLACLMESGEMETIRHAHALYYLELAEAAEREYVGPQQVSWIELLEREHGNLRASMQWLMERKESEDSREMALRLGGAQLFP